MVCLVPVQDAVDIGMRVTEPRGGCLGVALEARHEADPDAGHRERHHGDEHQVLAAPRLALDLVLLVRLLREVGLGTRAEAEEDAAGGAQHRPRGQDRHDRDDEWNPVVVEGRRPLVDQ